MCIRDRYVDEQKLWDIPRAFVEGSNYKKVIFRVQDFGKGPYYISELRLAETLPDTRSKLMTDGRFVTTGIPVSYTHLDVYKRQVVIITHVQHLLTLHVVNRNHLVVQGGILPQNL